MAIGILWIATVCLDGARCHTLWMWHSQNLTAGEMIPRTDAVNQMRSLSLAVRDIYRPLVIPAAMILIGGVLNGIRKK